MDHNSTFAAGKLPREEGERFAASLDRQAEMPAIGCIRSWVRDQLHFEQGSVSVDVGCGTGQTLSEIADLMHPTGVAVGVDANSAMTEVARSRTRELSNVTIVQAEAANLPIQDQSVQAVTCERVLQHLSYDPAIAVEEFARVVSDEGFIAITDTDWSSLKATISDNAAESTKVEKTAALVPLPFTTNMEAGRLIPEFVERAGLEIVSQTTETLANFDSVLVQGVIEGLAAAARKHLPSADANAVERSVTASLARGTFRVSVNIHAVVARRP